MTRFLGAFVFLMIWILGCWVEVNFLNIEERTYLMAYGALLLLIGSFVEELINDVFN